MNSLPVDDSASDSDHNSSPSADSDSLEQLREKYSIKKEFRKSTKLTAAESAFGKEKYPPDWNAQRTDIDDPIGGRREAVYEYQNYRCGRCRTDLRSETHYHCHHYRPLEDGATHELQNLIVLCLPCHKLIHPDVEAFDADWREAPLFPSSDADPRVATIRKPATEDERAEYRAELQFLERTSVEGQNTFTTSRATYSTSPTDAIEAEGELSALLESAGFSLDQTVVVRVEDQDQQPVEDATVELILHPARYEPVVISQKTAASGETQFQIPESVGGEATVRKDGFELSSIDVDTASEYTVGLKPVESEATYAIDARNPAKSGAEHWPEDPNRTPQDLQTPATATDEPASLTDSGQPTVPGIETSTEQETATSDESTDTSEPITVSRIVGAVRNALFLAYLGIVMFVIGLVLLNVLGTLLLLGLGFTFGVIDFQVLGWGENLLGVGLLLLFAAALNWLSNL